MPVAVNGVSLLVACTRVGLEASIRMHWPRMWRLEASDASKPWYRQRARWFFLCGTTDDAMNYQHTYLGLAVNQAKLYYIEARTLE